jgi:hypothetical protein
MAPFDTRLEASMAPHTFTGPRRTTLGATVAIAFVCVALSGVAATASAAPRNDDFADASPLRLGRDVRGNINGATRQRGEPQHANSLATHSVWYRFTAKRRVGVLLGTCSSNFDTVVAVYSGRRVSGLREVDFNNDGCGRGGGSRVSFTARKGKTYRIAVAGFAALGRFKLTVDRIFTPLNDDLVDAVALTPGTSLSASTHSATRELREPAHADNLPHTVWFKLSVPAQTQINLNACNSSYPTLTVYTGSSMGTLTRVATDDNCAVSFTSLPGTTYRIVAENGGSGGSFRIRA